ncbi:hypothetical protein TELCIR_13347, partial [Teladorsagia circumcincta]
MKRGSAVDREISQKYANDKKMSTKEKEILRIPLVRTAVVHVLRAESPSCVWVRLTNHITDKLILTEPKLLVYDGLTLAWHGLDGLADLVLWDVLPWGRQLRELLVLP